MGEGELDIFCKTVNKLVPPCLVRIDYLSDGVVDADHLPIDTDRCFVLSRLNFSLICSIVSRYSLALISTPFLQ